MATLNFLFAFIFILGAAVILHEFGHFIVAKLFGIRVETFSFGFGPRLFGVKRGTTDYRVSAIPLGGYVKLGGDDSNAPLEGAGAPDIPREEQFNLRPRYQRVLVAVAGPVMNILTALAIPFAGAMIGGLPPAPTAVVVSMAEGGAAQQAGLRPGDRIVKFNGADDPSWDRIRGDAMLSPGIALPMTIERDGKLIDLTIKPSARKEGTETVGDLDFLPDYGTFPVMVSKVEPGSPAEKGGMQKGDRIVSMNGWPAKNSEQIRQFIRDHKGQPIQIVLERNGQTVEITAQTAKLPSGEDKLGLYPYDRIPIQRASLGAAASYAVSSNIEILRLTKNALGQIFKGQRSARETLSGPIGIARASATAVEEGGVAGVFAMLGFLSLNLGIFNLLPIPVLDGGAIFILLVEALIGLGGWKLSITMRERIQQVGLVVLLLLMGFVITNDLIKEYAQRWGSKPPAATAPAR